MKPKLKICGMRDAVNIMSIAALKPDYMGFIFYEKSKRFAGDDFSIPDDFPPLIKRVGVFVNAKEEMILNNVEKHKLDFVQLHGNEPVAICRNLKANNVRVIKVFLVDHSFDFEGTKPFQEFSDFFLFDTKSENYGGTGKIFDWGLLKKYDQQVPFFLSGGISSDNIHNLNEFNEMNLHAIDVNSGAEAVPGFKDPEKVNSIITILNSNN